MKEKTEDHNDLLGGFEQAQKDWGQLTHLRKDPRLKYLVEAGLEILPDLFDRLLENCVYYLPIEEILRDLNIDVDHEILPDWSKDGIPPFGSLEVYKESALKWWEKNKEKLLKQLD